MSMIRKIGFVLLGILFALVLVTANITIAADRTVLDAEFAKDTAEEADIYATMSETMIEEMQAEGDPAADDELGDLDPDAMAEEVITEEYVRGEMERNIDAIYAFLHGERDDLVIEFRMEPLVDSMLQAMEDELRPLDLAAIDFPEGEQIERMAESEDQFEAEREAFREEQKAQIQEETPQEMSDEELEAALDEQMAEIQEEMSGDIEAEIEDDPDLEAIAEPAIAIQEARINALAGDIEYETYSATVEDEKEEIVNALLTELEDELKEELAEEEELALTDELGEEEQQALEDARAGVQLIGTLAIVLPLLALGIVGLLAWIGSPTVAALESGIVASVVGGIMAAGSWLAVGAVVDLVGQEDIPPEFADLITALVEGVFGTLMAQSGVLLVLGLGAFGLGVGMKRGIIEPFGSTGGAQSTGGPDAEQEGEDEPADEKPRDEEPAGEEQEESEEPAEQGTGTDKETEETAEEADTGDEPSDDATDTEETVTEEPTDGGTDDKR